MGDCLGDNRRKRAETKRALKISKTLDSQLQRERMVQEREVKLLLLGSGESGKSTIMKQIRIIYMKGISIDERKSYIPIIYHNVIGAMIALIKALQKSGQLKDLPEERREDAQIILGAITSFTELTLPLGTAIKKLWDEPIVKARYANSSDFQIIDSAAYFFDSILRLSVPNYVPEECDVLHARVRTTGIVEITFEIGESSFRMVDVGGQRSERRKWVHYFQDVTAILFVVAMNEYDQQLREDQSVGRMEESMNLFEEICNCNWFSYTAVILFLNKSDLFKDKASRINLNVCFPDYTGGLDPKAAIDFLKNKFITLNRNRNNQVYSHVTCATFVSSVTRSETLYCI